jgi:hypothetical protein
MSCQGWQNRAEAWMPRGAALILEDGFDPNGQFYFLRIHGTTRLDDVDHTARQALAQYMARAPVSLQKLTYNCSGGKVLYHTSCNSYFKP